MPANLPRGISCVMGRTHEIPHVKFAEIPHVKFAGPRGSSRVRTSRRRTACGTLRAPPRALPTPRPSRAIRCRHVLVGAPDTPRLAMPALSSLGNLHNATPSGKPRGSVPFFCPQDNVNVNFTQELCPLPGRILPGSELKDTACGTLRAPPRAPPTPRPSRAIRCT